MTKKEEKKDSKIEDVRKELIECEKIKEEYLAGWQRSRADFLNYKKEEFERREKIREFAENELILKIIKILDDLERAKKEIPEDFKNSDWLQGFFQIENQFKNFLKGEKIEEINPKGEKFNPNFHEAVEEIETEKKEEKEGEEEKKEESGKVLEVLEKGYKRGEVLLRAAKVKVSK